MKLTNRLATIASKVPYGDVVADIGTDHAYIPIFLVKKGIIERAIAADVAEGPLKIARENIESEGLEESIETRLGSGLTVLEPGEADCVIIAGMGGILIRDLLEESKELLSTIKTMVLQPMIAQEVVREWLYKNGFKIVDESLAKEGEKYYQIIVAEHGEDYLENEIYLEIGKKLFENHDPLLKGYLVKKMNEQKQIMSETENKNTEKSKLKKAECQRILERYKELYDKLS